MNRISRADFIQDEHLEFLDNLQKSAKVNMLTESSAELQKAFPVLERFERKTIVLYWVGSYEERHPKEVEKAEEPKPFDTKKTYWNNDGKYQKDMEKFTDLIPNEGESDNPKIELLRNATNIYYDYNNNGFCNKDNYEVAVAVVKKHTGIELMEWGGGEIEDPDGDGFDMIKTPEKGDDALAEKMMDKVIELVISDKPLEA